nr:uncharacterized protein LOC101237831 [Hydra vulgaris]
MDYYCQVEFCRKGFYNARGLINHMMLQHSHEKQLSLSCSLDSCGYRYNTVNTFRCHLFKFHASYLVSIISDKLTDLSEITCEHTEESDREENIVEKETENITIIESVDENANKLNTEFSDFLKCFGNNVCIAQLQLREKHMLPLSAASDICDMVKYLLDLFQNSFVSLIRQRLKVLNIESDDDSVLNQILTFSSIYDRVSQLFATDHLKMLYMLNNLEFVPPKELDMPANELHQFNESVDGSNNEISSEILSPPLITNTDDIWASCERNRLKPVENDGIIRDYSDGTHFKSLNVNNNKFIRLHLYNDELEICNALGSRRGTHKISIFYFIVGNVDTHLWTNLDHIHLVLVAQYSAVKRFGYDKVLNKLMHDVKLLEIYGLDLNIDGSIEHVNGSIVTFSGDNLSSHSFGGFSTCFSSGRICRHCMVSFRFLSDVHSESSCQLRTIDLHKYHVQQVKTDKSLGAVYGVLSRCSLSSLQYFNAIECFPPDFMHDGLEGLLSVNFSIVVRNLIKEKLFTIVQLKEEIAKFKYSIPDSCDKPAVSCIPNNLGTTNKRIHGKAVERWSLFHFLPVFVSCLVKNPDILLNNNFWQLHLLCRQIVQIILAPEIDINWIPILEHHIQRHHSLLECISPVSFIPKIHYLVHYPRLLLHFGPLRHLWVMRFESKHQYFKQIARRVKNFKNITFTLTQRHEMRKCVTNFGRSPYVKGPEILGSQKILSISSIPFELVDAIKNRFGNTHQINGAEQFISTTKLRINGQVFYTTTSIICQKKASNDMPLFGKVKYILLFQGTWIICCVLQIAKEYIEFADFYTIECSDNWVVVIPGEHANHSSLGSYFVNNQEGILFRHHVCIEEK